MAKKNKKRKSNIDPNEFNAWVDENMSKLEQALGNKSKAVTRFPDDELTDEEWFRLHAKEFENDDLRYNDYWERHGTYTGTAPTSRFDSVWTGYKANCHTGNKSIVTFENGGTLYAGGISRGAKVMRNMLVVDLTGGDLALGHLPSTNRPDLFPSIAQQKMQYVSLPILDFGQPEHLDHMFWLDFAADIKQVLVSGTDVLVCCLGGHGRTGIVVSILMGIWSPDMVDPIAWLRNNYCIEAVETRNQERYVHAMLTKQKFVKRVTPAVATVQGVSKTADKDKQPFWNTETKKLEYR